MLITDVAAATISILVGGMYSLLYSVVSEALRHIL